MSNALLFLALVGGIIVYPWAKRSPSIYRRINQAMILVGPFLVVGAPCLWLITGETKWFLGFMLAPSLTILIITAGSLITEWGYRIRLGFRSLPSPDPPLACPPVARLKDLLAERLPQEEQARLNRHLESCPACQRRLEGLVAGKESWSGLAKRLSQRPQREPALKQVMENLKHENDPNQTHDEPVINADLPLGFLSPADKPDQLGRLGPYEVLAEIGRGGMGIVLKAFDPTLHRVVAIKVLAPQLATSGVARKRFMREAQAVAAVTHDHIVTIHAVEEANGLPYLVMQYIAGLSLQDRIDKEGPLPLKEILRIGVQTAAGLAAAHAQGIIHRDIKPANILLENGVQRVKLTDFGLARAMDDAILTQSGFVAGSPQYMAPEQARGEALDHRADLFSLGSVLYTMCTGRPPFRAANTLAVLRRVSEETPRPMREVNPEIPDWLAAAVDKLHAKEPAERYQSAGEVAEVLGRHLAELQQASYVPMPLPAPRPVSDPDGWLTSLTICPNCAAQLHVPEKMVGETVQCPECGKPFRVEEGSEEIHIARAVQLAPIRAMRARKRLKVWLLSGVLALLFLVCLGVIGWFTAVNQPQVTRVPHPLAADARTAAGYMLDCLAEGNEFNLFLDNAIRPPKIEPFHSWAIQTQEESDDPRAAGFRGTLITSTGNRMFFTMRLWKRQGGLWGIASFALPGPASPVGGVSTKQERVSP
jgi:serine/threonine protein kinase